MPTPREKFKEELNSILDEGREKREGTKDVQERQKIMLWEMDRIRHVFEDYKKTFVNDGSAPISREKPVRVRREQKFEDKKPSQKTRRA